MFLKMGHSLLSLSQCKNPEPGNPESGARLLVWVPVVALVTH